jgi:hypothetical protein
MMVASSFPWAINRSMASGEGVSAFLLEFTCSERIVNKPLVAAFLAFLEGLGNQGKKIAMRVELFSRSR